MVFLDQMRRHGHDGGLLMIPGSTADFTGSQLNSLTHPLPDDDVEAIFTTGKAAYIADYAERMAPVLAAEKARWAPAAGEPLLEPLRALFEPIMLQERPDLRRHRLSRRTAARCGPDETVVLDFPKRAVREPIPDEKFRYGFAIAPELVRTVLRDDEPDWVNTIFLSTRFTAWRVGGYNEYLYTFFKCLTDERIAYADGWFAETHDDTRVDHAGRLGDPASLPAPQSRPVQIRGGRRQHADLQPAWLAMAPGRRPLPDVPGSPAAELAGA